ncbi:DUF3336 domain-containing protein [uncultured Abyssibacter sp.]|uniref:DUF3336 domain-containing protein n=1 Tax=uncultured Abyssibacter sp. TaxID=2320202 RepID=UPI0032B2F6BE
MSSLRECRRAMRQAGDYATWADAAQRLDELTGGDAWKSEDESSLYDFRMIRARLRQIRRLRERGDIFGLMHELRQGLHWNIGGIGSPYIYAQTFIGTKHLVSDYIDEVCRSLEYLAGLPHAQAMPERQDFFEETALSFGRTGLMLSGGATLGLFHIGVIKSLWEHNALPRVISGSSAGSVVAATLGTHTDDEIEEIFDADMARFGFWRGLGLSSIIKRRALMDQAQVRRGIQHFVADMTFDESYRRTGRVVNVTVSPANTTQSPKLLNHVTFPHLCMREAVLASCAVPVIFEPVLLYQRDHRGAKVPFLPNVKWVDGSMKSDLPQMRLRRLHNVNHFIVSQTNPHVVPFMALRGSRSRGGRTGILRAYALEAVKEQAKLLAGLGRDLSPPGHVRKRLDTLHGLLEQQYRGNITVVPSFRLSQFRQMMSNPSVETTREMILAGERATWPKLSMILHQTRISQTFDRCLKQIEGASDEPVHRAQLKAG